MPLIKLHTEINAPIERCFDLSRSIDLHKISTSQSHEEAIAGRISGLIQLYETVTWRARHFGLWRTLTTKITACRPYEMFVDEMTEGDFKSIYHRHTFTKRGDKTIMKDEFSYESPFGWIGKIFNLLVLNSYMKELLSKRNTIIKEYAETERWREVLK